MPRCAAFVRPIALVSLCTVIPAACTWRTSDTPAAPPGAATLEPPAGYDLQPVAFPDFSTMQEAVRTQMDRRYEALLSKTRGRSAAAADLADAYGEMGRILMASTHFDAAEACYLNAQTLAPEDRRWPYYLGHLYKVKGPLDKSIASFERALRLHRDVATLVWLGEAHLARGRADAAKPLFEEAIALEPASAAAHFGAGRAALSEKNFPRAVAHLEEALARDPRATSIQYPLAMAHRGLGNLAKAREHLARQGDVETRPRDPLMQELDALLQSPEAYNVRGGQEFNAGNWEAAAANFRKGLELAPNDPSLRHRLGTALFQMGDARGAMEQFERALGISPAHARSHFSLGVLLNDGGRHAEAVERFSNALTHEPGYVQARVQLAGALARSGRPGEAIAHYQQALATDPTLQEAAFGYAMALVRLRRFREAATRLEAAIGAYGDQPMFSHALARLLAAAPDEKVRDGQKAKVLIDGLLKDQQPSIELAETTAMMLAELGRYEQASAVQRDVVEGARRAGVEHVVRRTSANLQLYVSGQPCRTPFGEEELP